MSTSMISTQPMARAGAISGTGAAAGAHEQVAQVAQAGQVEQVERAAWLAAFVHLAGEETVALDEQPAEKHRAQMKILGVQAEGLRSPADYEAWMTMARGQLHSYRMSVERRFDQQKKDLESAGTALRDAMDAVAQQGMDQTQQVEAELKQLDQLMQVDELEELHKGIGQVSHNLADIVRGMQTQNSMMVAQMRDEIRTLQTRLEMAERRSTGAGGNLSHRGFFERKLQAKISADEVFSLFLVRIANWKQVISNIPQERAQALTDEVSLRVSTALGAETFAGRWYDGYFAAVVNADKRQAIDSTQEIVRFVSGGYKVPGVDRSVQLSTRVAVLEHYSGQSADHLLRRVDELIRAFERP